MSREAEVDRCPVCGAPVARGARSCNFCAAPLSTVRCAGCFAMNAAAALHCAGCGERLGLEPIPNGASDLACPACQQQFLAFGGRGGRLGECERCGGQFVEHGLLEELFERRQLHQSPALRPPPPPENPLSKPVRYVKCPGCAAFMNRRNFGGTSGIVVDVCVLHGVWFEVGELPRVLAFVQAGGLERAKQRSAENRQQRERERRIEAASSRVPALQGDGEIFVLETLGEGALELLGVVLKALGKTV